MRGVYGWTDDVATYPSPFRYDARDMALAVARREDRRLLDLVAHVAGLPYRLHAFNKPDQDTLEVRVPGVRLAAITRRTMDHLPDADAAAVQLGRLARQGWFAFEPLPVPDNVELGDN